METGKVITEMLREDMFWEMIEQSLTHSTDMDEQEEFLKTELAKLEPNDMVGFKLRVTDLAHKIHTSHMWCAGYLMNGGCSDDAFDYFKNWVVSRGKNVYYKAKEDPDTLVEFLTDDEEDYYEFETLDYVACDIFEEKTGDNIYDYLPIRRLPDFEFDWEEDDLDSMKAICPMIFEKVDWE